MLTYGEEWWCLRKGRKRKIPPDTVPQKDRINIIERYTEENPSQQQLDVEIFPIPGRTPHLIHSSHAWRKKIPKVLNSEK